MNPIITIDQLGDIKSIEHAYGSTTLVMNATPTDIRYESGTKIIAINGAPLSGGKPCPIVGQFVIIRRVDNGPDEYEYVIRNAARGENFPNTEVRAAINKVRAFQLVTRIVDLLAESHGQEVSVSDSVAELTSASQSVSMKIDTHSVYVINNGKGKSKAVIVSDGDSLVRHEIDDRSNVMSCIRSIRRLSGTGVTVNSLVAINWT